MHYSTYLIDIEISEIFRLFYNAFEKEKNIYIFNFITIIIIIVILKETRHEIE